MGLGCIYVIRTFVLARNGKTEALPPTICFERDFALEMAEADQPEAAGVAVYEIDTAARAETEATPFAAFGLVPENYWRIARNALLAAAPAVPEPAR
jgi:hypothetical protein